MVRLTQLPFVFVSLVLTVQCALAAELDAHARRTVEPKSGTLLRRQFGSSSPSAPSETGSTDCTSTCQPYENGLESCQQGGNLDSCYCTQSFVNNIASCADCALATNKTLNVQNQQALINTFVDDCQEAGFSVTTVTVKPSSASTVKASLVGVLTIVVTLAMLA